MAKERRPWRRVSRGFVWMTWGVFLLLTTLDVLPWSFWGVLLAYWPVLLMMLGVRIIFERSPAPWVVLVSPLLLIGTMSFVAFAEPELPRGPTRPIHASRSAAATEYRIEGDLAMMDLNLRSSSLPADSLVTGEATTGQRGTSLYLSGNDRSPRVRMRSKSARGVIVFPFVNSTWGGDLRADLANDLPVSIDLDMAMVEGYIDLSRGYAERVEIEGAFQDLRLRLPEIDEDVNVHLHGAFNRMLLEVPSSTPMRYSTDGFIVMVDGREDVRNLTGPAYRLHVEGAFTWVEVRSYEAPSRVSLETASLPALEETAEQR